MLVLAMLEETTSTSPESEGSNELGEDSSPFRKRVRDAWLADELDTILKLVAQAALSSEDRQAIAAQATQLVKDVRTRKSPGLMEAFLSEYGLSSQEGIALMCLAEALLRVPDAPTMDSLIADKITPGAWRQHIGASDSRLVNATTWALLLTGRVVEQAELEGLQQTFRGLLRRLGEPVIRAAVNRAMRELGDQFVLATDIGTAFERAKALEAKGFTFSYDMLGEGARNFADADRYFESYIQLARAMEALPRGPDFRANPGISIKLSALHPRYEYAKRDTAVRELADRVIELSLTCRNLKIGLNVDAEESDRLDVSLDIFERVVSRKDFADWPGFGIVVQAYGRRASPTIDWIYDLACRHDRQLMVRLVKGAYWDTEIKRAQVLGIEGFPVFTRKANTDISYISCARRLLSLGDRIYPQFGSHNAHTVSAILHMAKPGQSFEFQRIHGMGIAVHELVLARHKTRCRIYAPVGDKQDLLAYLVRRLLENGANSSFVHKIVDTRIPPEEIGRDPFQVVEEHGEAAANPRIARPAEIFGKGRKNAKGWDIADPITAVQIEKDRAPFAHHRWRAEPPVTRPGATGQTPRTIVNPSKADDIVGEVMDMTSEDIDVAYGAATRGFEEWGSRAVEDRARILDRIAELYEAHAPELMALAAREAGKIWIDGVGEIREAVDFCRYYASEARRYAAGGRDKGRGVIVCISPWNFPIAIFTGQIVAALAAGNAVLAKPAGQTTLIGARAIQLMHEAGVPGETVQLVPGSGGALGGRLVSDPRLAGVCFTGSTETARLVHRAMAHNSPPTAPLAAETGGLNAMIVDSTALPEQAVLDIIASAFQSAGQRCSALRVLYIQKDVETELMDMLCGAMDTLSIGDPWLLSTDIGPLIDASARASISEYCEDQKRLGRLIHEVAAPKDGNFLGPLAFRVNGIEEVEREVFGPVLHVATYASDQLDEVVDRINRRGYGLTLAVHSRIERRIHQVLSRAHIGNMYVNRNQIGAVVGSQPFGGEGLSGTGPKAGGPHFVGGLLASPPLHLPSEPEYRTDTEPVSTAAIQDAINRVKRQQPRFTNVDGIRSTANSLLAKLNGRLNGSVQTALEGACSLDMDAVDLPGPTGETNQLSHHPRGVFLCVGTSEPFSALMHALPAVALGNWAVVVSSDAANLNNAAQSSGLPIVAVEGAPPEAESVLLLEGIAGVCASGPEERLRSYRIALADREDEILPLISGLASPEKFVHERSICVDTTASGGNASLMVEAED